MATGTRVVRAVRGTRGELQLRWIVVALTGVLAGSLVAIWVGNSDVPPVQAAALVLLAVVAAHREAIFSDETAVSGSALVVCASVVGFTNTAPLVPLLCAAGAALHQAHLRHLEIRKLVVNLSGTVLPALAAATFFQFASESDVASTAAGVLGCVAIYWLLNNAIVGLALALATDQNPRLFTWELIRSDTVMLVFAVGGALCGVVMTEVGPWAGIVALVAVLVSLDVFVISVPAGPAVLWSAWKMVLARLVAGAVAGFGAAAVAFAVSDTVLGGSVALVAGIVLGLAAAVLIAIGRLVAAGGRLDLPLLAGFAVAELPLVVIASSAGVIGAEVGAAAGIFAASALVIAGSVLAAWRRHRDRPVHVDDAVLLAAVTEAIIDGMPDTLSQR